MFLVQALIIIGILYWISAIVAEITMTSKEEQSLAPAVKVGFGYLISLVYFSGACLALSTEQAWLLGVILLFSYAYGKGRITRNNLSVEMTAFLRKYIRSFLFFILGALLFFIPLIISNNYGPFTEGGGDISIYADTAKYIQDKHLTAFGMRSASLQDIGKNIKETLSPAPLAERWKSFDTTLINPPAAEYASYRVLLKRTMSSFLYIPYIAYGFFKNTTNYPAYFGIQAFFYVCMLSGVWYFFRRFNFKIATLAILLVAGSHSIVSIFYNMYAMQAASITISALILSILPTIRFFSRAGLRTFGSGLLLLGTSYILYYSVVLPLIVGISFFTLKQKKLLKPSIKPHFSILAFSAAFIFITLGLYAGWVGIERSWAFLISLLQLKFFPDANTYFGDKLAIFSREWLSFLFGFVSQQHISPFIAEISLVVKIIMAGIFLGGAALFIGFMIMCRVFLSKTFKNKNWFLLSLYLLTLFTVVAQAFLGNASLYFQAKGAQNVLIYLYAAMLLPLGVGLHATNAGLKIHKAIKVMTITLVLFSVTLLIPRMVYTTQLAFGMERGDILESSYFAAAKKIKNADPEAFVLFEPRKSADLYISMQPFFGKKFVSTRHLILSQETLHPSDNMWLGKIVLASDLIEIKDLPHLWTINSHCKDKSNRRCKWQTERLINRHSPSVLLFANDYTRNLRELPLNDTWAAEVFPELITIRELFNFWAENADCHSRAHLNINKCLWNNKKLSKPNNIVAIHYDDHYQNLMEYTLNKVNLTLNEMGNNQVFSYIRNGTAMAFLPQGGGRMRMLIKAIPSDINHNDMVKEISNRVANGEFGKNVEFYPYKEYVKLIYDIPKTNCPSLKLISHFSEKYWLHVELKK